MSETAGKKFLAALNQEHPLQIVGTINAFCAMLAEQIGFKALYLSGAGVANASYGLPDLGITTLNDVLEDVRRITRASSLPLLVDADTGWGSELNIARTVRELIKAGAAAMHIEDQVAEKRCDHRPGKMLVPTSEMQARIKAAVDARYDDFQIMARTDALQKEGLSALIDRANDYVHAGADMIFAEAVTSLEEYGQIVKAVKVPVLANMTEFGKTPLFSLAELRKTGVSMVLYPLSAFRAMSKSALNVYESIRASGTQKELLESMQTRQELYRYLKYEEYEKKMDELLTKEYD